MSDAAATDSATPEDPGLANVREALKRRDKELADTKAQLDAVMGAARAREFDDAGVPANGWGEAFRKSFEGELTQDAIRAQVEAWGIPAPQTEAPATPPADPSAAQAELETLAQANALRGQAPAVETSDPMLADLQQLQANGGATSQEQINEILRKHGALTALD